MIEELHQSLGICLAYKRKSDITAELEEAFKDGEISFNKKGFENLLILRELWNVSALIHKEGDFIARMSDKIDARTIKSILSFQQMFEMTLDSAFYGSQVEMRGGSPVKTGRGKNLIPGEKLKPIYNVTRISNFHMKTKILAELPEHPDRLTVELSMHEAYIEKDFEVDGGSLLAKIEAGMALIDFFAEDLRDLIAIHIFAEERSGFRKEVKNSGLNTSHGSKLIADSIVKRKTMDRVLQDLRKEAHVERPRRAIEVLEETPKLCDEFEDSVSDLGETIHSKKVEAKAEVKGWGDF
ncbi:hypothetical protein THIOSC15_670007 [uncultured Thiomicrorhabdus sp.]